MYVGREQWTLNPVVGAAMKSLPNNLGMLSCAAKLVWSSRSRV